MANKKLQRSQVMIKTQISIKTILLLVIIVISFIYVVIMFIATQQHTIFFSFNQLNTILPFLWDLEAVKQFLSSLYFFDLSSCLFILYLFCISDFGFSYVHRILELLIAIVGLLAFVFSSYSLYIFKSKSRSSSASPFLPLLRGDWRCTDGLFDKVFDFAFKFSLILLKKAEGLYLSHLKMFPPNISSSTSLSKVNNKDSLRSKGYIWFFR